MHILLLPDHYYRYFCCSSCGYQEQVAGEKFYDEAFREYMDSFYCMDCHIIHEKMVTESTLDSTLPAYLELKEIFPEFDLHLPGSFRDYSVFETVLFAENKVIENIECYSCGGKRNINWSKDLPYCPKCRDTMEMKYKDRPIQLKVALYGNEEQQKIHQFAIDHPGLIQEMISAYHSFTEEEIFKYRNLINWKVGSCNNDIQWNSKMIEHCRYYLDYDYFLYNPAFRNPKLIEEFVPGLKRIAVNDEFVSWAIASNKHIHWTEELIDRYIDRIDFDGLSLNSNVAWSEHILKKYEDRWDWFDMILKKRDIPWTLPMMEMSFSHISDFGLLRRIISLNNAMISNLEIVEKYFNWFEPALIFANSKLPWQKENLLERWVDKLDWDGLSRNQSLLFDPQFFEQNMERWLENDGQRFSNLSSSTSLPWSLEFIERFYDLWDWENLSYNPALPWSEAFIDRYVDKWNWKAIKENQGIPWTIDLMVKYNFSDHDAIIDNRSIWDKAFKPHINDGLLETLLTKINYPATVKVYRHTMFADSWMNSQYYL